MEKHKVGVLAGEDPRGEFLLWRHWNGRGLPKHGVPAAPSDDQGDVRQRWWPPAMVLAGPLLNDWNNENGPMSR